jgi:tetratricopeptide (TPR) repeat protein
MNLILHQEMLNDDNFFSKKINNKEVFTILTLLISLLFFIYSENRSYILGLTISSFFIFRHLINWKKYKSFLLLLIFLLILFLIIFVKTDSSLGRIFIYKISLKILIDHLISGISWGNFHFVYKNYQSEYFDTQNFKIKELLLADNTSYAFNDYLQFIIEIGIIGVPIILLFFFFLSRLILNSINKDYISNIALIVIISISIAALFTHTFEKPLVLSAYIVSIFILYIKKLKTVNLIVIYSIAAFIPILIYTSYYYKEIIFFKEYKTFNESIKLSHLGFKKQALKNYSELYNKLHDDEIFLSTYGKELVYFDDFENACKIFDKLISLNNNSVYLENAAKAYYLSGNINKSEHLYIKSINTVPNRFIPRMGLLNLYLSTGQKIKATTLAKEILRLPVKISSYRINEIKDFCKKIILTEK